MNITVDWLVSENACPPAIDRARAELNGGLPLSDVIERLDRADWLIWLLRWTKTCNRLQLVKLSCLCARTVLHLVPPGEDDSRLDIEAAEAVVRHDTPQNRARAARAAWPAGAAARAALAAEAAAWAAAWAAGAEAGAVARAAAWAAHHKDMCALIRDEMKKDSFKAIREG